MPQTRPVVVARPARGTIAPERDLTHPLDRLRRIIRVFVFLDVVLFVGLYLTVWFWAGVGVDYGLFKLTGLDVAQHLTPALRIGTTVVLALALVALVVWRVTVLVNKRFTLTALALVLEKRHPKLLGDRLITAIQMADVEHASRQGYSADLVRHTIKEARERMRQVSVAGVFNWGRLFLKFGLTAGVWVLAVAASLALYLSDTGPSTGKYDLNRGVKKTADVCGIFTERNLLFVPTPWPRKVHLEVVDFDDRRHPNELRVGKGTLTPPKLSARAVKWVVADDPRKNPDGWRAMTVADLKAFGIATPPGTEGDDQRVDDLERAGTLPVDDRTFPFLEAAADDPANSRTLRKLEVPNKLKLRFDAIQSKARKFADMEPDTTGKFTYDAVDLTETVRFTVTAEDFVTARRQITLVLPPTLVDLYRDEFQPAYLHHSAPISADGGDTLFDLRGRLTRRPANKVAFASDKSVFSVPVGTELFLTAESDKDLQLIEVRAVGPNPLTVPEFLRAEAKEETRDDRGVITSDRFVELPITRPDNAVDTRLETEGVTPEGGKGPPGLRVKEAEFGTKKLGVRRFTLKFDGKRAVRQLDKPTEFQIDMTDTDGVKSTRTVAVTAIDDAPPVVEVLVDPVLRRVGGAYMVTPIARIPFLPDSKITDDVGLSAVRFEFKKTANESKSVVALRAIAAASVTANSLSPIATWGMPATVVHSQTQFDLIFGGTIPQTDPNATVRLPGVDIERFATEWKTLQRLTAEQLADATLPREGSPWADQLVQAELDRRKISATNMPPADLAKLRSDLLAELKAKPFAARPDRGPQAVRAVKLSDATDDAFDLRRFMPELLEKQLGAVQQQYAIELFVTARDVNVELTGKDGKPAAPRTARNLDPIRLNVVSESDLLVEIGKDEEMQGQRMADADAKAVGGKSKLDREFSLIRTLGALGPKERNDQIQSTQVRVTDITQDLGKVRELLSAMKTEYEKLYREMDVNRFAAPNMYKYRNERGTAEEAQTGYLDLIALILDENKALAKAEKSVEEVRSTLAAGQSPNEPMLGKANADYLNLLLLLKRLSDQIATGKDATKLRDDLKRIIDAEIMIQNELGKTADYLRDELRRPTIVLPKQVPTVKANGTTKVKLGVRWKLYPETSLFIGIDPPATSELKTPKELVVKAKGDEDVTEVEVEITAGSKTGVHTITLLPGTFRKVELQIEVTK